MFAGHGSPFNLFQDNDFTRSLKAHARTLPPVDVVVVISAHWFTRGTFVTSDERPKMVYDYFGFPREFYEYVYPASGSPETARKLVEALPEKARTSDQWGIDHAATIPLQHLFPGADVPVVELSVDATRPPEYHYELGRRLRPFREEGVLFVGSGNLVHTFREFSWEQFCPPFPWALELDAIQKEALLRGDVDVLVHPERVPLSARGFPTLDHYLPALYIAGMQGSKERVKFVHESFQHGSVSHRTFTFESL
ncbi:MAG: 4,5-DOPA dioxygenase extradiol [Promethearchaeota archaeon]